MRTEWGVSGHAANTECGSRGWLGARVPEAALRRSAAARLASRAGLAALACVALVSFAAPAQAQTEVPANWRLKPSDLGVGDQFRLLFVTLGGRNASGSLISTYDTFIQSEANSNSAHPKIRTYSSQFKALASTAGDNARDNTGTTFTTTDKGVPIYYLNGAKVADDYEDFYDGSWDSHSPKDQSGSDSSATRVWTGTNSDGTSNSDHPLGSNNNSAIMGDPTSSQTGWVLNRVFGQDNIARALYALSPVFQVSSTLGPTSIVSVAVTSTPTAVADTYGVGEKIQFTVTFYDAVEVSASRPHFEFSLDGTDTDVAYEGGSGTTALTFSYTVQAADMDDNGIWVGDESRTIKLDTGEYIRGVDGQLNADLDHVLLGTQADHKVNGSLSPPNTAPTAANGSVTTTTNSAYTFDAGDFNFADTDSGDTLEKVKIVTLPRAGTLALSGTTVMVNQEVTKADIDADNLTFTPATDATGSPYTTFTFKVNDGDDESASAYTMSVNVTEGVCAAPTLTGDLRQIWTGTLTVGSFMDSGQTFYGFTRQTDPDTGGLSRTAISVGSNSYTANTVSVGASGTFEETLRLRLNASLTNTERDSLVLHVCDDGFPLRDFSRAGTGTYTFADSGLDWSSETSRTLYLSIDDTVPSLESTVVNGSTLVLTYDEELDEDTSLPSSAFWVIDAGTGTAQRPGAATASGTRVTLSLPTAVKYGDDVLVTYTPPGRGGILDRYGNPAGAFSRRAVVNETPSPARLGAFDLTDMVLRPRFNPKRGDYEAVVPHNFPDFDTIEAEYVEASTFEVLKPSSDYRSDLAGYQVRIGSGETEVRVQVTSDDARMSKTYTVRVIRLPRLTLSMDNSSISENGGVATVTASAASAVPRPVDLRVVPHIGIGTEYDDYTVSNGGILHFAQGATASTGSVTITAVDNIWDHPDRLIRIVGLYGSVAHTVSPAVTGWHDIVITDDESPDAGTEPVPPGPSFGLTATLNDNRTVTLNWNGREQNAVDVAARWRRLGGPWSAGRVFHLPDFIGTTTFRPSGGVTGPGCAPVTYEFQVKLRYPSAVPPDYARITLPPHPLPSPLPAVSVTSTTDGYVPFQSSLDLTAENMPSWTMARTGDLSKPLCGVRLKFAERDTDRGYTSTMNFNAGERAYDFRHPAYERNEMNQPFCAITAELVGDEHYTVDALRARGTAQVKGPGTTCDDLFDATMTVGKVSNGTSLGYARLVFSYGELSATTFMRDGTTYTVKGISYDNNRILVALDKALPASFGLRLDGTRVSGFGYSLDGTFHTYTVPHADPGWSVGDTVAVELFPAPANPVSGGMNAQPELSALTVGLETVPEGHDGADPFMVRLAFSEAVATTAAAMREQVFAVTGGAVTAASRVAGRPGVWDLSVRPNSRDDVGLTLAATASCDDDGAVCTADGRALRTGFRSYIARLPLTVAASDAPAGHNGSSAFTLRLAFSEPIPTSYKTLRDHAITVTGGTLSAVRRVDGRNDLWKATVAPSGAAAVELALPPTRTACDAEGAVCTSDGGPLQNGVRVTVPRAALTSRFKNVPASHDGSAAFTLRLAFSEAVSMSYKTLRDHALTVANGTVTWARRVDGRSDLWSIAVQPASGKDVTVTLQATASCEDEGAVCTAAKRKLTTGAMARVRGSAALTAAFEQVPESHDGAAFTLRLAFSEPVGADGATLRAHALQATGGTVTSVSPVDGRRDLWEIAVDPELVGDASLTLAASASCGSPGAVCTEAGKALSAGASAQIAGPAALTAAFEAVPARHDGATVFALRLAFSEAISIKEETLAEESLAVTGGTVVRATRVDERSNLWEIVLRPSSTAPVRVLLAAPAACEDEGAVCTATGLVLSEDLETTVAGPDPATLAPLTAAFAVAPEHDEAPNAFTVQLRFSAPVATSPETLRDEALAVTGGTLSSVARVRGRNDLWSVETTPSGAGPVSISLAATASCDAAGAVCTADGRALTAAASVQIALTARKAKLPRDGHDGTKAFWVEIEFSAVVAATSGTMRDAVLMVTHGEVKRAWLAHGWGGRRWKFRIKPSSHRAVQIVLPATQSCEDEGAVCTADGWALSNRVEFDVLGPRTLSVADAEVREAANATLEFAVRMSRASSRTVTVDYATSDDTATAGSDYKATNGTLTFAAGERSKTVSVAVLDDAHDEGEETFTLTLSNVTGGAYLADATATGTITNSDPLQRAWLARFGRTAATHVVDAVSDRLRGPGQAPSQVTIGGYRLPLGQPPAGDAEPGTVADSLASVVTGLAGVVGLSPTRLGSGDTGDPWSEQPGLDPRLGQSLTLGLPNVSLRNVLLGSSFRLALGADAQPGNMRLTAWGRMAGTQFDGKDGELTLDGDVLTGTVGVDGEWDHVLAGVAVAHSRGEGSFTMTGTEAQGRGDLENTLTSIHPYLRYAVTERLDVWGVLGYGWGQMDLETGAGATLETDTSLVMGAFGGRGILLAAAESGGFQLATRTDAMLTRTSSDAVAGLASADAEAHRLRVVLEGSRGFTWAEGRSLTPTVELGLRHDWGDAETGFGLEVGGRVQYADPALGLTIEGAVRGLLAHEDRDYQEWGASGTVRLAPGASGQGLALTLAPTWGAVASGVDGLWSRQTTAGLAPQGTRAAPTGRLNAEVSYGVPAFGTGLLTPYAGTVLSEGETRTYRVGGRWAGVSGLQVNLEGQRQEPAGQQPVNQGLRLQATWGF